MKRSYLLLSVIFISVISCSTSNEKSTNFEEVNKLKKNLFDPLNDPDSLRLIIDELNAENERNHQDLNYYIEIGVLPPNLRLELFDDYNRRKDPKLKSLVEVNIQYASEYDSLNELMQSRIDQVINLNRRFDSILLVRNKEQIEREMEQLIQREAGNSLIDK